MELKMTVHNKKIEVGEFDCDGVSQSSIVLIGDTEEIISSTVFDTPADSLIISKQLPIRKHYE
ncbi:MULTISPECIES: hypothetical protein [Brevibacillus]|jgi:spore germination protein PD|uniref:Spore germination protein PD n=1 Tax=Brevibacillus centrosporus TaxID=54910 RepID=A0A1I3T230_9BACL|nr:hypothetical protein BCE02nite_17970 [Brevibacillus centrosporus]SFJ63746.1 spore germination protein PD [Brevibacillus centrosporus]